MSPVEGPATGIAEDEAMAEIKPPALARITGSTGTSPLADGALRALIVAVPAAVVAFLHVEFGFLSNDGIVALEGVLAPAGLILWATFDRYARGRLLSS